MYIATQYISLKFDFNPRRDNYVHLQFHVLEANATKVRKLNWKITSKNA